jgi:hypothetical protein
MLIIFEEFVYGMDAYPNKNDDKILWEFWNQFNAAVHWRNVHVLNHAIDHMVLFPALTDKSVRWNDLHGYLLEELILIAVQILPVLILLIVIVTLVILERVQVGEIRTGKLWNECNHRRHPSFVTMKSLHFREFRERTAAEHVLRFDRTSIRCWNNGHCHGSIGIFRRRSNASGATGRTQPDCTRRKAVKEGTIESKMSSVSVL